MSRMRYEAEVVGHHAPYKWTAFRAGATVTTRYQVASGESETFEEAVEESKRAALEAEDNRLHAATKSSVIHLFEVDLTDPEGRIIDAEVRELESWLDLDGDQADAELAQEPPVQVTHDESGFTD